MPKWSSALLTVVAATALLAFAPGAYIGYDAMYHLVWGSQVLHGHLPDYRVPLASTPHPLQVLAAVPLSGLGAAGPDGMRALTLLASASVAVALGRIGTRLYSPAVGVLAGVLFLSRPHLIEMAHHGDADLLALALVAWAADVALRGRRPRLVLVLLAAAGLCRPEPWLLSGAYLLYAARGRPAPEKAQLAVLAAAGPLLWGLSDLIAVGDPLWSFTHTDKNTQLQHHQTGLRAGLTQLPHRLGFLLGLPALLVGALGFAAGLRLAPRRTVGVTAVAALFGVDFLVLAGAGLSVPPRYLVGLAAAIALFAAIGALGWLSLERGARRRAAWRVAGLVGCALLVAGIALDAGDYRAVRAGLLGDDRLLEDLARGGAARTLRSCHPVHVPQIVPIPFLAYWTGVAPAGIVAGPGATGSLVTPTPATRSDLALRPPLVAAPPPGARRVAANRVWRVYAAGCVR